MCTDSESSPGMTEVEYSKAESGNTVDDNRRCETDDDEDNDLTVSHVMSYDDSAAESSARDEVDGGDANSASASGEAAEWARQAKCSKGKRMRDYGGLAAIAGGKVKEPKLKNDDIIPTSLIHIPNE